MSNLQRPLSFTSDHTKPTTTEEKQNVNVIVKEAVNRSDPTWTPGVRHQFPWLRLGALVIVVACSVASVMVLALANKSPASSWLNGRIAPNVLIQIFNNLSNVAITLAVGQGVAITWWRKALSGRYTVKELHYAWSFSTGIGRVVKKIQYFNVIALAALMTKLAVVDGVLYQKSISTYIDTWPRRDTVNVTMFHALQFPVTGTMGSTAEEGGSTERYASGVVKYWIQMGEGLSQLGIVGDCAGASCLFGLQGAGFDVVCVDKNITLDYGAYMQGPNVTGSGSPLFQDMPLFSINFTRSWPSQNETYSSFILETVYATPVTDNRTTPLNGSCPLTLTASTCELRPAVLNYTMQLLNPNSMVRSKMGKSNDGTQNPSDTPRNSDLFSEILYDPDQDSLNFGFNCDSNDSSWSFEHCGLYNSTTRQLNGVEVISIHDVTENFIPGANSTLEGIFQSVENVFSAKSVLSYNGSNWFVESNGTMPGFYFDIAPAATSCNYTTYDPKDDIIRRVNYLTTLISQSYVLYYPLQNEQFDFDHPLYNIPTSAVSFSAIPSRVTYKEVFYSSNFHFMYNAIAATFVVVVCICPVYYGFWELGREVTLGPLEIANAFQGPVFAGLHGDNVDGIMEHIGNRNVFYGYVDAENGGRLAFIVNLSRS